MNDRYGEMQKADALEHCDNDGCDCMGEPFDCPNKCGGKARWDMGSEGHICSNFQAGCDYYDGTK